MVITSEHWAAVCGALGLDPAATLSVNITPEWVYIVHADQALTSQQIVQPVTEES